MAGRRPGLWPYVASAAAAGIIIAILFGLL